MVDTNTYLFRSVSLIQQRGLAKAKEIPTPYPVISFGTENVSQEEYLKWLSATGMKQQAYLAFVKVKMNWFSHWGDLATMNALMPEFNEKFRLHIEADFKVKEWGLKNTLKPTPEQQALMDKWGGKPSKPMPAGMKQNFLNAFYKEWAVAKKEFEVNCYGPFTEMPPQPYLALLGLANVAQVPKNASLQGQMDDATVYAYLMKYKNIWFGIPTNFQGVLVNI